MRYQAHLYQGLILIVDQSFIFHNAWKPFRLQNVSYRKRFALFKSDKFTSLNRARNLLQNERTTN